MMSAMEITRRWMARLPVMYEQLMRIHPDGMPSLGMVSRWDRVGGFTSKITKPTEQAAMKALNLRDDQKEMLSWLDCVYDVFFRLLERGNKSNPKFQHDHKVAKTIQGHVFEGLKIEQLQEKYFYGQSQSYIRSLYNDAVAMVAKEAERRNLIR